MKKKTKNSQNYLDKIPVRSDINWTVDSENIVTLEIENRGWANRIAQVAFKKPKISYVHLDKNGSFVWQLVDGVRDITSIGVEVKNKFGDSAEPLYERLSQFFRIMESYSFIKFL